MRSLHLFPWIIAPVLISCGISRGADVRTDFLKLIDRPRVPLAPVVTPLPAHGDLSEFHFVYASDARQMVPGILVKPAAAAGRLPVVIALHGTGGSKTDELPLLRDLAGKGFITVAIDGPWHGERSRTGKGTADYNDAILRAWRQPGDAREHPFFYDTVWDVMRLVDYLQTREDVDPKCIGLYGVSKGGIETYLTAAVDERVSVAVPCIGLESFKWADDNNAWPSRIETIQEGFDAAAKDAGVVAPGADFVRQFYAKVAPRIDGEFDGPSMAPLIAPRALMTINGDSDPRTPPPSLKLCTDAARAAYHAANADDHLVIRIQPHTAHKVNADSQAAAVEWFIKWLNPSTSVEPDSTTGNR